MPSSKLDLAEAALAEESKGDTELNNDQRTALIMRSDALLPILRRSMEEKLGYIRYLDGFLHAIRRGYRERVKSILDSLPHFIDTVHGHQLKEMDEQKNRIQRLSPIDFLQIDFSYVALEILKGTDLFEVMNSKVAQSPNKSTERIAFLQEGGNEVTQLLQTISILKERNRHAIQWWDYFNGTLTAIHKKMIELFPPEEIFTLIAENISNLNLQQQFDNYKAQLVKVNDNIHVFNGHIENAESVACILCFFAKKFKGYYRCEHHRKELGELKSGLNKQKEKKKDLERAITFARERIEIIPQLGKQIYDIREQTKAELLKIFREIDESYNRIEECLKIRHSQLTMEFEQSREAHDRVMRVLSGHALEPK